MGWRCYAKPAALGGKVCGHENDRGIRFNGLMCCEGCGCTKAASDYRRDALERAQPDRQIARPA